PARRSVGGRNDLDRLDLCARVALAATDRARRSHLVQAGCGHGRRGPRRQAPLAIRLVRALSNQRNERAGPIAGIGGVGPLCGGRREISASCHGVGALGVGYTGGWGVAAPRPSPRSFLTLGPHREPPRAPWRNSG